jgi:mono/diheme cytochrome c family protein
VLIDISVPTLLRVLRGAYGILLDGYLGLKSEGAMALGGKPAVTLGVAMIAITIGYIVITRLAGPAPSGAPMRSVTMPDMAVLPPMAGTGAALFEKSCAGCHGAAGGGRDGFGPPLIDDLYRPDHHSDAMIESAILNGAEAHHWNFGNMPPVLGATPEKAAQIIAYLRAVQVLNGIY